MTGRQNVKKLYFEIEREIPKFDKISNSKKIGRIGASHSHYREFGRLRFIDKHRQ